MFGRYRLSNQDFEGYGVYEHDYLRSGAFGQLPNLSGLQTAHEEINGLAHVRADLKPTVKSVLETMQLNAGPDPQYGGQSGVATYMLGQLGQAWVSNMVSQGYVVMVDPDSVPSGAIRMLATNQPASVVLFSGTPNADYVIVDAHPAALAAAEAYRLGQTLPTQPPPGNLPVPTQQGCPPGQVNYGGTCWPVPPCPSGTYEVFGVCFPILGVPPGQAVPPGTIPGTTPGTIPGTTIPIPGTVPGTVPGGDQPGGEQPVAKAGLPSWALPVGVAVAVIGLTTAVVVGRRRRR